MPKAPVQTPTIGSTTRTSSQRLTRRQPIMNAAPDRYMAPRKRACNGGTGQGMAIATRAGRT